MNTIRLFLADWEDLDKAVFFIQQFFHSSGVPFLLSLDGTLVMLSTLNEQTKMYQNKYFK